MKKSAEVSDLEIIEAYQKDRIADITKKLHIGPYRLYSVLKRNNIQMKKRRLPQISPEVEREIVIAYRDTREYGTEIMKRFQITAHQLRMIVVKNQLKNRIVRRKFEPSGSFGE